MGTHIAVTIHQSPIVGPDPLINKRVKKGKKARRNPDVTYSGYVQLGLVWRSLE